MIYCDDIQSIINEFIYDIKSLLAWRHTCKHNMTKKYFAIIDNLSDEQNYNESNNIFKIDNKMYIHNIFNIIKITQLPAYFNDSYIINCKFLIYLDCFNYSDITDYSVKWLNNLQCLYCNKKITDKSICKLSNLQCLHFNNNTLITDTSLICLKNIKKLVLNDQCKRITDISLSQLTNLTKLDLGYNNKCYITNNSINNLTNLTILHITGNKYIDSINLPNLTTLHANKYLKYISCPNLTKLYCSENESLTDDVFYNLSNLTFLDCGFNNEFTNKLLSYLPKLTFLDCGFNTKFDDNGLILLQSLKTLYCSYNNNFNNQSLPHSLTFLSCGRNDNFTARGLLRLKELTELQCKYGISGIDLTDLKPLHKLKKVNGIKF